MSDLPVVAIVGRANVGKSTLVNRLIGRRAAIEHPEPGVTRDRQAYDVRWNGRSFRLVDTGGWEPRAKGLAAKVLAQAERASREADVIVMVVDAQTGITDDDLVVARGLRRSTVPILIAANKVDTATHEADAAAVHRLGLGDAVPVSALHGRRSGDLLDMIVDLLPEGGGAQQRAEQDVLAVAIVGRPNVGKSSLFNRLVGDERSIVHDMPGTTRDTVDTVAAIGDRTYRFIDTAGMRRRAREASGPEYYGLVRSLRAIEQADIALHVIDVTERATDQDQRIARTIADAGCAAVIVLNKWDLIDGEQADELADDTRDQLRFVSWAPLVRTSAETKRGVAKLVPAIEGARAEWEKRVPTAMLNAWLRDAVEQVPLGTTARGRPVRIRYMTQVSARPPKFAIFANGQISDSGLRAIERRLRNSFGFEGTPIRLMVRLPDRRRENA